jgi:hypothetical protein
VSDIADDFAVAQAAGFVGDAEVAGIYELDELGRFVIEQSIRIIWVRGALPENRVARFDMRFALCQAGRGVAAMAIGAAEHDIFRNVHRFNAGVAFEAAAAFAIGFGLCLVDSVSRGELV